MGKSFTSSQSAYSFSRDERYDFRRHILTKNPVFKSFILNKLLKNRIDKLFSSWPNPLQFMRG